MMYLDNLKNFFYNWYNIFKKEVGDYLFLIKNINGLKEGLPLYPLKAPVNPLMKNSRYGLKNLVKKVEEGAVPIIERFENLGNVALGEKTLSEIVSSELPYYGRDGSTSVSSFMEPVFNEFRKIPYKHRDN